MPAQSTKRVTGLATFIVECDPEVTPKDFIYIDGDGIAKKAKSDDIATMPAVGYVVKRKPNNKCVVTKTVVDEIPDLNASSARKFFISETEAGKLQETVPTNAGSVIQGVCTKLTSDKFLINVGEIATVRS